MTTTTVEMGRRLTELGLDTSTADMRLDKLSGVIQKSIHNFMSGTPAWSLEALLDLLSDSQLVVWRLDKLIMNNGYHLTTDSPAGGKTFSGKTKIEAVYNAVVDMLERRAKK